VHITLLFSLISSGQNQSLNDTIRIHEVVVNGILQKSVNCFRVTTVDSVVLKDYSHNSIADVISENTTIFIKNYGYGGAATISQRGTGAGYTIMTWNDVNINSPMLGQSDLSLIPAGFIDEINIYDGGASLYHGSGGFGGTINIATKPVWKDGTELTANFSAGSFGRYSALAKVRAGTGKFQSSTKVLYQTAENNFTYQNNFVSNEPVSEKRKNASTNLKAFIQELYFRDGNNLISARLWYQNSFRNIPVPITNQQPDNGENQEDEFLRSILSYSGYKAKTDYSVSLSWFSDNMIYKNPLLSINSKNLSNTVNLKGGIGKKLNDKNSLDISFNEEYCVINSVNYDGNKSRNIAGISVSNTTKFNDRLSLSALVRENLKDNIFLTPDYSAGLQVRVIRKKESFIHFSISHNSKVPTMNDMYWNPGGNTMLKTENNYTCELSYDAAFEISSAFMLKSKVSLYDISILDMIKWTPGSSGYWSPSNIDKANSAGAEGSLNLTYVKSFFNLKFDAEYSWNHASLVNDNGNEEIKGKQLIYTPEHLFTGSLRTSYKNYYITWLSSFTSKRYTSEDNSHSLSPYLLNNLSFGIKYHFDKSLIDINIKAENIFNVNYQTIAWYPMPGRSFMISLIYQFTR
jgi:vitamin B12 transporter